MNTPIIERIRDALSCPVEHPVPLEVFSPFEMFNPETMEVIGDVSDDEVRIIRLLNEIGYSRITLNSKLKLGVKAHGEIEYQRLHYTLACMNLDFNVLGQLLSASMLARLGDNMAGIYAVAKNGKVVRVKGTGPKTH